MEGIRPDDGKGKCEMTLWQLYFTISALTVLVGAACSVLIR